MKTASIRDVRHDFNRILAWVDAGEEVMITKHRLTVARLLPVQSKKNVPAKMPQTMVLLH